QLSSKQATKIKKLGKPVVPGFVPTGFKLSDFSYEPGNGNELGSYSLKYRNKKGAFFLVQMASDGIGDIFFDTSGGDTLEPTKTEEVKLAPFGTGLLEFLDKGAEHQFHLQWVDLGDKARPR